MKEKPAPKKPRVVEIVRSDYQPSKAELAEPIVLDATFEKLMHAVVQPVTIRTHCPPKEAVGGGQRDALEIRGSAFWYIIPSWEGWPAGPGWVRALRARSSLIPFHDLVRKIGKHFAGAGHRGEQADFFETVFLCGSQLVNDLVRRAHDARTLNGFGRDKAPLLGH